MGGTFSSFTSTKSKSSQPKDDASKEPNAASNTKRKRPPIVAIDGIISRRSRRITKSNPAKVIIPTKPKSKTPRKKYPLTPKTRKKVEEKSKPILLRKSPRHVKHKVSTAKANSTSVAVAVAKSAEGSDVLKYTPNATYDDEELIFAWDKGILYEAKVIKGNTKNSIYDNNKYKSQSSKKYYVHYIGYKKSHDKWITPMLMLKVDHSSRKLFRETRGKLPEFSRF